MHIGLKFLKLFGLTTIRSYNNLYCAFIDAKGEVKSVRKNAEGLVNEYNGLEAHKNEFVAQNLQLRAALLESQDQIAKLTIALHEAQKNDHRDEKGRFTKEAN